MSFRSVVGAVLIALVAGCRAENPQSTNQGPFPSDPRASYPGKTWNGQEFPALIGDDSINHNGRWELASQFFTAVNLIVFSQQQYRFGVAYFWVLKRTGDTVQISRGGVPSAIYDAGSWQYDQNDGSLRLVTQNVLPLELRGGEFHLGELEIRGLFRHNRKTFTVTFGKGTPVLFEQ